MLDELWLTVVGFWLSSFTGFGVFCCDVPFLHLSPLRPLPFFLLSFYSLRIRAAIITAFRRTNIHPCAHSHTSLLLYLAATRRIQDSARQNNNVIH
jgi:hypothetical protein